ncbi:SET and MYND domain-containing protein 4-like isoform X3 [Anopheles merus]|uniref:SET and MYND domain-containing protein 4-like isoform X3 n=1 Tax=Anopheles merus TaxID=30066 RepID=UPI001BE4D8F9|nr:SET and MYND domain-containing protein 4-like isoform X3 [Anopheles merus]
MFVLSLSAGGYADLFCAAFYLSNNQLHCVRIRTNSSKQSAFYPCIVSLCLCRDLEAATIVFVLINSHKYTPRITPYCVRSFLSEAAMNVLDQEVLDALQREEHCTTHLFEELWTGSLEPALDIAIRHNPHAEHSVQIISRIVEQCLCEFPYREFLQLHNEVKYDEQAAKLRTEGNKMVDPKVKRLYEAVKLYNESITYTKPGSTDRSLAYANRSVVCLQMHRYEECLANIRLAREANYPARLADKLDKREEQAKEELAKSNEKKKKKKKDDLKPELPLSFPGHEHMPHVANCLQLQQNEQYGRHVVTTRRLKVGDVMMLDTPFVKTLQEDCRYVRCDFCHAERPFTLIPCEGCTWVMYCSAECLSKAYDQYHRYECGVMRDAYSVCGRFPATALRATATAISIFDGDLVALQNHLDALDESRVNGFTMDWRTATPKDVYNTVHVLPTNQERRGLVDHTYQILVAILLHKAMVERIELGPKCKASPKMDKFLFDLILRHVQTIRCNHQLLSFYEGQPQEKYFEYKLYGAACYPSVSMLNHSCASNVRRLYLADGRCAMIVIRPIDKDCQLFDSYGLHHLDDDRVLRQRVIQLLFNFQCSCEACTHNYRTFKELSFQYGGDFTLISHIQQEGIYETLATRNRKLALKIMRELQTDLNRKHSRYPSYDVCGKMRCYELSLSLVYVSESFLYCRKCTGILELQHLHPESLS